MSTDDDVTLVVLGASGDLFSRLLLPGLAALLNERPGLRVRLIGTGRNARDDSELIGWVRDGLDEGVRERDAEAFLLAHTSWRQIDPSETEQMRSLLVDAEGRLVLYFALPPAVTMAACRSLDQLDVPDDIKIVAEKPFGTDAASAAQLDRELHQVVDESAIHRVDHFLGMAAVLDILGLRFTNRLVSAVWDSTGVESVEIVYDEVLGLEGRADFYDGTGALEDMIQSHLLQVLALVAMEPPAHIDERDLRDQIAHALRATRLWDDDPVASSVRGRYTAGTAGGKKLPSYVDEDDVDPSLETETFAEVRFAVDTERWAGVPFRLRSGKALSEARRVLRLNLRPMPRTVPGLPGPTPPEAIELDLKTGELTMELSTNGSGDPFHLERSVISGGETTGRMPPYGEVLRAVLDDDLRLSVRGDVAIRCWELIEPVQRAWSAGRVPLQDYPAGSDGPEPAGGSGR